MTLTIALIAIACIVVGMLTGRKKRKSRPAETITSVYGMNRKDAARRTP